MKNMEDDIKAGRERKKKLKQRRRSVRPARIASVQVNDCWICPAQQPKQAQPHLRSTHSALNPPDLARHSRNNTSRWLDALEGELRFPKRDQIEKNELVVFDAVAISMELQAQRQALVISRLLELILKGWPRLCCSGRDEVARVRRVPTKLVTSSPVLRHMISGTSGTSPDSKLQGWLPLLQLSWTLSLKLHVT